MRDEWYGTNASWCAETNGDTYSTTSAVKQQHVYGGASQSVTRIRMECKNGGTYNEQ